MHKQKPSWFAISLLWLSASVALVGGQVQTESEAESPAAEASIEDLNLVGAAVSSPPIADTVWGSETRFRRALYRHGLLFRLDFVPRFSSNLLDAPVPRAEQAYIGHRPTWITGIHPMLTADLRQLRLRDTQLNVGFGWRWTDWDPAGPKTVSLSRLYLYKAWADRRVEMKLGYLGNDLEFMGLQIGGSLANGAQGVYAVLPFEVGMSYWPSPAPSLNFRLAGPNRTYLKVAAQRSLDPGGNSANQARNPRGFRFIPKGNRLLLINEFGFRRSATDTERQVWVRVGYMHNKSRYKSLVTGERETGNYCAYGLVDFQLRRSPAGAPSRGLYLGGSIMTVPEEFNAYSRYYEGRLYHLGPFRSRPDDVVSVVASYRRHSSHVRARLDAEGKSYWTGSTTLTGAYSMHVSRGNYMNVGLSYVRGAAITPRVDDALVLNIGWFTLF
ncbi:MAG: hypothetical protein Kow001_03420 [Acidobacteriota bacterium]